MSATVADWIIVLLLGGLVGSGELVSRYRDEPLRALLTGPAIFYIAVNMAASLGALALSRLFGWTFGGSGATIRWTQVLVAGFGAMALFRSSLFTVRAGDKDVAVGPASFLQIILDAADSAVDRVRAEQRSSAVVRIMAGVAYAKAHVALPAYCLALMQNLSAEDQAAFARQIAALDAATMDDTIKVLTLGLAIMNVMGDEVLQAAVKGLGARIKGP